MMIDADGALRAYHPDDVPGLDRLAHAGAPGNWWGIVTERRNAERRAAGAGRGRSRAGLPCVADESRGSREGARDRSAALRRFARRSVPRVARGVRDGTRLQARRLRIRDARGATTAASGLRRDLRRRRGAGAPGRRRFDRARRAPRHSVRPAPWRHLRASVHYVLFCGSGNGRPRPRRGDRRRRRASRGGPPRSRDAARARVADAALLASLLACSRASLSPRGEVAEWLMAAVLKTARRESVSRVRIPPSPPSKATPECPHPRPWRSVFSAAMLRRPASRPMTARSEPQTSEALRAERWPSG